MCSDISEWQQWSKTSNLFMMKPIEILKKGLAKLQFQIQDQKTRLMDKLKASQPISDSDEDWLDNAANLADEEWVVDILDHTSDYKWELRKLNSHDKSIMERLQNLTGNGGAPTKKCKHMVFLIWWFMLNPFVGPELLVKMSGDQ